VMSKMNLKSLVLSSDDKTTRILRRVLSDLEIDIEHCSTSDQMIRRLTRDRFEAFIVDCSDTDAARSTLRAIKAAPVNKRALSIVLVESQIGLKGGFDMGAHFVLHKPLTVERAKSSFRAVRALMKRERRAQLRVPVQIALDCAGSLCRYRAKTLDLCEGGMAVQFDGQKPRESIFRFSFQLPGVDPKFEFLGEMAWQGDNDQVGVRFRDLPPQERLALRDWLNRQLPDIGPDDPPIPCRLTDLSLAACYVTTSAPFPVSTRVILSIRAGGLEARVCGMVRIAHAEYGMGIEFLQSSPEYEDQLRPMVEILRSKDGAAPEVAVEPDGLETAPQDMTASTPASDDVLVKLFHQEAHLPVEAFLEQMQWQRQLEESS